jgi:hypothetical protein
MLKFMGTIFHIMSQSVNPFFKKLIYVYADVGLFLTQLCHKFKNKKPLLAAFGTV